MWCLVLCWWFWVKQDNILTDTFPTPKQERNQLLQKRWLRRYFTQDWIQDFSKHLYHNFESSPITRIIKRLSETLLWALVLTWETERKTGFSTIEIWAPLGGVSVTGTIFPSIFPPLVHTGAVELRLAQPDVDVIMDTTEPLRKSMAAPGVWLIGFQSVERKWCFLDIACSSS